MQQQKLSEVNVGALERRTRYGPQRAPVQQFHPFEQSPSGARRKDATIGCMRKSIGFPCLKCVEWRHVETKEKLGASCAEPGCAWPIFFQFTKTGCEIKNVSCIFPGHALQSAGAKCNSIRIQILAKQ